MLLAADSKLTLCARLSAALSKAVDLALFFLEALAPLPTAEVQSLEELRQMAGSDSNVAADLFGYDMLVFTADMQHGMQGINGCSRCS